MNRFGDISGDVSTQLAPWELRRRGLAANVAYFELREEIRFQSDIAGGDIVVPAGFLSDLASIPQFAWSIFMASDDPRIELGGWIHDLLYSRRGGVAGPLSDLHVLTRRECDRILAFEGMVELSATPFQRWAVYVALRLLGGAAWRRKRKA